MELKEITYKIVDLLGCSSPDKMGDKLHDIVLNKRFDLYDKYLEICPDLNDDWIRKIYQFFCADRKEKKQDYTPDSLGRLLAKFSDVESKESLYDCCCGSGSLIIQAWRLNKELIVYGEELDEGVIPFLLFNLSIRNITAQITRKNILSGETFESYKLIKSDSYSIVEVLEHPDKFYTDIAFTNPPFNLNIDYSQDLKSMLPEKTSCNFAFIQYCLNRSNAVYAILPNSVLTSNADEKIRKSYIDQGVLRYAISMPESMFDSTTVSTCVLGVLKNTPFKQYQLIDASKLCSTFTRKQRGEGDASHTNRVYEKKFNIFTDQNIDDIISIRRVNYDDISIIATKEQLSGKKYSMAIGPYLEIDPIEENHRKINMIIKELNGIKKEKNCIKITINKSWGKELDVENLIDNCLKAKKNDENINNALSNINADIDKIIVDDYLSDSNSKLLKIENTDKEHLSTIMQMFFPMWKQHLYYLNEIENVLLGELRDALIPELMNGNLTIK